MSSPYFKYVWKILSFRAFPQCNYNFLHNALNSSKLWKKNRRFYTKTLEKNAKALKLKKDEVEDLEFGFALTRQG